MSNTITLPREFNYANEFGQATYRIHGVVLLNVRLGIELEVSLQELLDLLRERLPAPAGASTDLESEAADCPECDGAGRVPLPNGEDGDCPACEGTGGIRTLAATAKGGQERQSAEQVRAALST